MPGPLANAGAVPLVWWLIDSLVQGTTGKPSATWIGQALYGEDADPNVAARKGVYRQDVERLRASKMLEGEAMVDKAASSFGPDAEDFLSTMQMLQVLTPQDVREVGAAPRPRDIVMEKMGLRPQDLTAAVGPNTEGGMRALVPSREEAPSILGG